MQNIYIIGLKENNKKRLYLW